MGTVVILFFATVINMKSTLSLWALLLCLICVCDSMNRQRNKICYSAKICIHNGNEKCGVDGQGNLRRFYDSCDILEYNCLKGTDYAKTLIGTCEDLPPIDDEVTQKTQNNENQNAMSANRETENLEENDKKLIQTPKQEVLAIEEGQAKPNYEAEQANSNQSNPKLEEELETLNQEESKADTNIKEEEKMKLNKEEPIRKEKMIIPGRVQTTRSDEFNHEPRT